jgi:hypothetical protein
MNELSQKRLQQLNKIAIRTSTLRERLEVVFRGCDVFHDDDTDGIAIRIRKANRTRNNLIFVISADESDPRHNGGIKNGWTIGVYMSYELYNDADLFELDVVATDDDVIRFVRNYHR